MPTLIGCYAVDDPQGAQSQWTRLTAERGTPIASLADGPLHAALFRQHATDRAIAPRASASAASATCIGFGGHESAPIETLAPPWLLCRYDAARRTVTITPDRHGFALVYFRRVGTSTFFSTSALLLSQLGPTLPRDPAAIAELLAFNHLLGARMHRTGIELLAAGSELVITPEGPSTTQRFKYGSIALSEQQSRTRVARELVTAFRTGMTDTLSVRSGDEPTIVPLSGGLDSRLLVAAAAETGVPMESFTFAREHAASPPADVQIAREVAQALAIPWRFLSLEADWLATQAERAVQLTDGHCDVLHTMAINAARHFDHGGVLLDGIGGDVILGGVAYKDEMRHASTRSQQIESLWRIRTRLDTAPLQMLIEPGARGELRELARRSLEASVDEARQDVGETDPRWADVWTLRNRTRRFINNGQLLWQTFARPAFPYFAPVFFDRMLATHPSLRAEGRLQASLFHAGWPRMAAICWQKSGRPIARPGVVGGLVHMLRARQFPPGEPFFDFDRAFQESEHLRTFLRDVVLDLSSGIDRFGCFDRTSIERLFEASARGHERGVTRLALLASLVLADQAWSAPSTTPP